MLTRSICYRKAQPFTPTNLQKLGQAFFGGGGGEGEWEVGHTSQGVPSKR